MFGKAKPNHKFENELIEKLWARSGDYLEATGDRDMDKPNRTHWNVETFCEQAHDPEILVKALQKARMRSEDKLLQSIVSHGQLVRQIKSERTKTKTVAKNEKITVQDDVQEGFKNSPYTASEGYLKIILKNEYQELPADADTETVRKIITHNIMTFLNESVQLFSCKTASRIINPDPHYIDILVGCMINERNNKDKIVLYHATEPEIGALFDIFSELRNQLLMDGGNNIRTLRAIDQIFLELDNHVKKQANIDDFLKRYHGVADDNNDYRDMMLSTNFGLFGSDQQINADTYNMFYEVKDRKVATKTFNLLHFLSFISQKTGITLDHDKLISIINNYVKSDKVGKPQRNGRLLQILIDPETFAQTAYFSVLLGAPVLKDGKNTGILDFIKVLRSAPNEVDNYLQDTSGSQDMNGVPTHHLRPNTLKLHDLQARFFMRPENMFNAKAVNIKSYFRFEPPVSDYYDEIKQTINQSLVTWLKSGSPSDTNAFMPTTNKLNHFVKTIYKGSFDTEPPSAPPVRIENQFAKLVNDNHLDQAAIILEQNYEYLFNKKFTLPADRNGSEKKYDLRTIVRNFASPELLKIAFDKGLFPGQDKLYDFALKTLNNKKIYFWDLLEILPSLKAPEKCADNFLNYFKENDNYKDTLYALDNIDNDESIIKMAQPLCKLSPYNAGQVLLGLHEIPLEKRQATYDAAVSIYEQITSHTRSTFYEESQFITNYKNITRFIYENLDNIDKIKISIDLLDTNLLSNASWDERIKIIKILDTMEWIKEPKRLDGHIAADFNYEDIMMHAYQKPEIYNIEFLESTIGKAIINQIIMQLNDGFIPKNDIEYLAGAYNRVNPKAGYNKSLIAMYAMNLNKQMK